MRIALATLLVLAATPAVAPAPGVALTAGVAPTAGATTTIDTALAPYREAERAGAVGVIAGRVFAERRKPDGPDTPIVSTTVILLPRSDDFLAAVEAIKRGARDTAKAYRMAAAEIRKTREAYERRLSDAGAGDFVRPTTVGPDGGFRFEDVPAGRWMIVATHGTYHASGGSSPTPPRRERQLFDMQPRLLGYSATILWLREVEVTKDAVEHVQLTDRNLWFSGVVEDKERDAGRGVGR